MTQSLRKQFSTSLSTLLLNDIQYQRSNYYYFLGKLDPWASNDLPPVQAQALSEHEDVAIRNNAAYFKKISPNDVTLVCTRYDWTTGTVYAQWDNTVDMEGSRFYVVTDTSEVYKCLNNNNGGASTVKPTGKPLAPFKTADGYTWKYMYTVPSFKRTRFTSVNYIPVQRALTESFYNTGSVESISVIRGGSGYTDNQQTFITTVGSTTGSGATATITVNASGSIQTITITNGGSGYTKGVKVSVQSSVGINAVLEAVIVGGVITGINIINPGIGYSASNPVVFTVGGAVLLPIISRSTGQIVEVKVVDGGAGYTGNPVLDIDTSVAAQVDGLYEGNSTAILEAVVDQGKVQRVLIRDPGVGYPASNDTTIIAQGDGEDLEVTPIVLNGEIVDVLIENPGTGYTNLILTVDGTGTGATLRPIFANSDIASDQSIVEQIGVDGAIYAIKVTDGGSGYDNATEVVIVGDGTGATAHCEVSNGAVTKVIMDTWGSGYTQVQVQFVDPDRNNEFNLFDDAQAYAILPPGNGHGVDAVNELYGRTLAISSSIRSDPLLTEYQQDYRQFGIVRQPKTILSNRLASLDFDFNVYKVTFNTVVGLVVDEILLKDSWYKYRVVYVEGNDVYLQPLQKVLKEPTGTLSAQSSTNRVYLSTDVVERPIINKYTGNLMYIANEQPFEFSETQGLLIKTYISF